MVWGRYTKSQVAFVAIRRKFSLLLQSRNPSLPDWFSGEGGGENLINGAQQIEF